ncbi:unnamed protein product [Cuscuta campestris]|uniref:Uncharacterized protein n=1 Tax=Cuscuta campestris TaxID=132261 RepID=A0A484MWK9_9ASTE|nr:unnamed protein product [Cuscuta campestris]
MNKLIITYPHLFRVTTDQEAINTKTFYGLLFFVGRGADDSNPKALVYLTKTLDEGERDEQSDSDIPRVTTNDSKVLKQINGIMAKCYDPFWSEFITIKNHDLTIMSLDPSPP